MIRDPMAAVEFHLGDCRAVLATLPAASVQCCVTSPPYYGLRSYGTEPVEWSDGWCGELGLEPMPSAYISHLVEVFEAVKRVLRSDGCLLINLGDSYNGSGKGGKGGNDGETSILKRPPERQGNVSPTRVAGLKPKDLLLMPHRVALALQEAGWWVRSTIVWAKLNPLPESVTDRPTQAHEYVFMLTRAARYYYDAEAVRENGVSADRRQPLPEEKTISPNDTAWHRNHFAPGRSGYGVSPAGRNLRSVVSLATESFPDSHFATMPRALVRPLILVGTSARGACPCGAPYRRVVDVERVPRPTSGPLRGGRGHSYVDGGLHGKGGTLDVPTIATSSTLGWSPTCICCQQCDALGIPDELRRRIHATQRPGGRACETAHEQAAHELVPYLPSPCVVLDPFAGSGTVGAVAAELGRRAILIDAKEEYIAMAKERVRRYGRPRRKPPEEDRRQLTFAGWEEESP